MAHQERVVPALHGREYFFLEHLARYRLAATLVQGRRVLDVACGTGYGSEILAAAGAARVCAVDFSVEALTAARTHHASPGVAHVRADAHALPFAPGSFDVAVSFETLEHLERPTELLARLRETLAPGGVLLASAPNALVEDTANPYHLHNWSPAELEAMLRGVFPWVRLFPQFTLAGSAIGGPSLAGTSVPTEVPATPTLDEAPYVFAVCAEHPLELEPSAYAGGARIELAWLEPLKRHIQVLEGGVAERDGLIGALRAEIAARQGDVAAAHAQVAAAHAQVAAAHAEVTTLRAQADTARADRDTARGESAEAKSAQADAERAYAAARAELEELRVVRTQLSDARSALREIESSRAFSVVSRYWTAKARARSLRDDVLTRGGSVAKRLRDVRSALKPPPPPQDPLVSVIVPVYNNAPYLPRMIESVLGQTYRRIELVLWDDCSTDPAVAGILASHAAADPRVRHLHGKRNLGISGATNEAIVHSTGEWLAFLDCDDQLTPEAISRVMEHARANPELGFVYTNRVDVDEQDRPVREWDFVNRTFSDPAEELLKGMFVSHLKVARRDALAKAGLLRSRYDLSQDYDHVLRLSEVTRFGFVREPVYRHRVHARQSTQEQFSLQERRAAEAKAAALLRRDVEAGRFERPVSILILSLNRLPDTLRCLEALDRHTRVPFELVVLDNGSDPEVREELKSRLEQRPRTKLILSDVNLGCAGGRREALRHASGEFLITLDNDIEVTAGWLGHLLSRLLESPTNGGACCRVVFPDGTLQFAGGTFEQDDEFIRFGLVAHGKRIEDLSTLLEMDCGWIPGGATVFRREVYDSVEFATGLQGAYEDNHFSLAVSRAGWRLVNAPLATVWHHHVIQNREAAKDQKYMAARYDRGRLWESVLEFYRLNGLILEDRDLWRQLKLPDDRAAVKLLVEKEATRGRATAGGLRT